MYMTAMLIVTASEMANQYHLAKQWNSRSLIGSTFSFCLFLLWVMSYRVKNVINVSKSEIVENQNDVERKVLSFMVAWPAAFLFGST